MSTLRKIIVDATSEMLDNPGEDDIYPTTKFYNDLEQKVKQWALEMVGEDEKPQQLHGYLGEGAAMQMRNQVKQEIRQRIEQV